MGSDQWEVEEKRARWKRVLLTSRSTLRTLIYVEPTGFSILVLGGSVIIESIFALPGIGQMAVQSTSIGDTPVVMGVVVFTVIIVILVNLAVDLINGWLNPKVRVA